GAGEGRTGGGGGGGGGGRSNRRTGNAEAESSVAITATEVPLKLAQASPAWTTAPPRDSLTFEQTTRDEAPVNDREQTLPTLTRGRRLGILAGAFLAWMFAGLHLSLFVLIHRQMTLELLGADTPEQAVTRWFAWYQAAFLFGAAAGGWLFGWLGDRLGRTRAMGGA